jgi:hypothetical protein
MEDQFDILDSLKKRKKPELPLGFFDTTTSNIMDKIDSDIKTVSLNKNKSAIVPEGFFENFSANLMDQIKSDPRLKAEVEKPKSVITLKILGFVSAVAACLLVFFMLDKSPESNKIAVVNTQEQESVDKLIEEDYLAYLDEADLIDFLIENEDITLSTELSDDEEAVYYLMSDDIEEIYLEELQ